MRKLIALAILLAFCVTLGVSGSAVAQKKHASKGVWKGMIANLTDVQGVTAALAVFDMERATMFADSLAKRERFVSTIERIPEPVRKRYAELADIAESDEVAIGYRLFFCLLSILFFQRMPTYHLAPP